MSRHCMRSGCDRPATSRLSYDAPQLQVWLDELTAEPAPVQEVCDFHAERLTAPRGWTISDRRAPRPSGDVLPSGRPPATVATVPQVAPSVPAGTGPDTSVPVPPDVAPAPEPQAAEPAPAPQAAEPAPAAEGSRTGRRRRRAETTTDGEDAPVPTGSLLSRAFRAAGHQHSVLTQDPSPDGSDPTAED